MIPWPKSLSGVIHLPDARLNFHLSFEGQDGEKGEAKAAPVGGEAKALGRILDQAVTSSPEVQELLIHFADYIKRTAKEKSEGQGPD